MFGTGNKGTPEGGHKRGGGTMGRGGGEGGRQEHPSRGEKKGTRGKTEGDAGVGEEGGAREGGARMGRGRKKSRDSAQLLWCLGMEGGRNNQVVGIWGEVPYPLLH